MATNTSTRNLTPENPVNTKSMSAGFDALKSYVEENPLKKTESGIMDKYAQRRQLASDSSAANAALIESKYKGMIGDAEESSARDVTTHQESQRGFGINMGALREFVKAGDRRVRDLTQSRDELLLQNKGQEASRLNQLLVDEQSSLTTARTTFLDSILKMGQEARAVSAEDRAERGFETPEQQRTAALAQAAKTAVLTLMQTAPDAGITNADDYNTAIDKYKKSHTYRTNQAMAEAQLSQINANIRKINSDTEKSLADTAAEKAKNSGAGAIDALKEKISLIDSIMSSTGMDSRVGPNSWARRAFAAKDKFGAGQDFAAGVQQLTNKETIDTLIALKERGGTLGALGVKEQEMLSKAASKINAWEKKDENGLGTGEWDIDEATFKKELETIKRLANKAMINAGGSPNSLGADDLAEVDAVFGTRSLGNSGTTPAFNASSFYK